VGFAYMGQTEKLADNNRSIIFQDLSKKKKKKKKIFRFLTPETGG
jgi:hypothetical protein